MESKANREVKTLKAHLALNVGSVESSIEFYKKMLGIDPSKVRKGYAKFDIQNPPLNLTLNEVQFDGRGALSHLGIQVASTSDVLAIEKWTEAGLITGTRCKPNCFTLLRIKPGFVIRMATNGKSSLSWRTTSRKQSPCACVATKCRSAPLNATSRLPVAPEKAKKQKDPASKEDRVFERSIRRLIGVQPQCVPYDVRAFPHDAPCDHS